jgi:hypothetical protein
MSQQTTTSSTVGIGVTSGAGIGILTSALFTGNVNLALSIFMGTGLGVVVAAFLDTRRRGENNRRGDIRDE